MHIENIQIKNYRNIQDQKFEFQKGLNVIIGANNSGKTNILKAINLIKDRSTVTINDFNKNLLKKWPDLYISNPPQIELLYTIKHSLDIKDYSEEKILKLMPFMEYTDQFSKDSQYIITAKIKMLYSLDPKCIDGYQKDVKSIKSKLDTNEYDEKQAFDEYLFLLKKLEPKFNWHYFNGITDKETDITELEDSNIDETEDSEQNTDLPPAHRKDVRNILDIEYIEADRNLEKMSVITKRLVKKIIDKNKENIDYCNLDKTITEKIEEELTHAIKEIRDIIDNEQDQIGINNGNIRISQNFDFTSTAIVCEKHCFNVIDTKSNFDLPLDYNGLGYNNLISIFLIIKLPETALDVFCIEEPEAHLHPAMQYKLFDYLTKLEQKEGLNKQIFITTHSSNITSVTGLDNMILLSYTREEDNHNVNNFLLTNQFNNNNGQEHKKHLMKFLDVTRSDMLFADYVILVEGITEKLLLPAFMKKESFDNIDKHISIVEIGGKHFEHFLSLFKNDEINKKVLCITDKDLPFSDTFINDYQAYKPSHIGQDSLNIKYIYQKNYGKTFEDELILDNFGNEELIINLLKKALPDSLQSFIETNKLSIDNWNTKINTADSRSKEKLEKLLTPYLEAIFKDTTNKQIYEKLFFGKLFLDYASNGKGKLALEILIDDEVINNIVTPTYIKEGIEWLKQ